MTEGEAAHWVMESSPLLFADSHPHLGGPPGRGISSYSLPLKAHLESNLWLRINCSKQVKFSAQERLWSYHQ
ncbi:hypothetical protein SAY87_023952 [Trapa incisa]|uniref:Uncharacterized protein n=1 Tax=Trapa incisa TaxID=236973 RepID=A0AAN7KZG7_9MYRT|nr:hypothetical protein SAY87_023952 [Trapa incisa]